MPKRNFTLARLFRVVVWLSAAFAIASGIVGAFGPEVAKVIKVSNLALQVDATNQYASYPWYLRVLLFIPPALAMAYAMARLAALLGCAIRSQVFSAPASGHLRSFGVWLLISTLADIFLPLPVEVLNVLLQSPEAFTIGFNFGNEGLWNVFFSTLIMLLARVLSDGYELAEENRQFI